MAVSIVGQNPATAKTGTGGTTMAYPIPSVSGGILAGDLFEVIYAINTLNAPALDADWNHVNSEIASTASPYLRVIYRWAVGGESGTFNITVSGTTAQGSIRVLRGVDPTTPVDGTTKFPRGGASTTFNLPSITTTVDGDLLVYAAAQNTNSGGWTAPVSPAGFTEDQDTIAIQPKFTTGSMVQAAAGSTGVVTVTSSTGARGASVMVAWKAAPAVTVEEYEGWGVSL